jgi:DNA invertase Pin-like site-specific DNA recombinase
MRATNWSEQTDSLTASRRAAGRRHYNARRQFCAERRRLAVSKLALRIGWRRGYQTEIARKLGVSRSTICRDLRTMHQKWLAQYYWSEYRGAAGSWSL